MFSFSRPLPLLCTLAFVSGVCQAQPDAKPRAVQPTKPITWQQLQALIGDPTTVTFSKKNVSVIEIARFLFPPNPFEETRERKYDESGLQKGQKHYIDVDWKDVPFWKAVRDTEAKSGLHWDSSRLEEGLLLYESNAIPGAESQVVAENPFVKVLATSLSNQVTHTFIIRGQRESEIRATSYPSLLMAVILDPKLHVSTGTIEMEQFKIPEGKTVKIEPSVFGLDNDIGSKISVGYHELPKDLLPGTRIASLKGTLHLDLITSSKVWRVPDILKAPLTPQTIDSVQTTLSNVAHKDNTLKFDLKVTFADVPFDTNVSQRIIGMHVRDAKGRELPGRRTTLTVGGNFPDTRPGIEAQFDLGLTDSDDTPYEGPYSIEWPVVLETKRFDVPFELKDVVVP